MLIKSNSLSKNDNSHTLMSLQTHMIFFQETGFQERHEGE